MNKISRNNEFDLFDRFIVNAHVITEDINIQLAMKLWYRPVLKLLEAYFRKNISISIDSSSLGRFLTVE